MTSNVNDLLRQEIEQLRAERDERENQIRDLERRLAEEIAECDQWQKKLTDDAWPEIERLRTETDSLNAHIEQLRSALTATETDRYRHEQQEITLRVENERLQAALAWIASFEWQADHLHTCPEHEKQLDGDDAAGNMRDHACDALDMPRLLSLPRCDCNAPWRLEFYRT